MKKIEHIGIAVKDLKVSEDLFERLLGTAPYKREEVESECVITSFFLSGPNKIELLFSTDEHSAIHKFIEQKGEGIHHIAWCVQDGVANALAEVEAKGVQLIDKAPRRGAEGLDIAFLHPKSTGSVLTELCETPKK